MVGKARHAGEVYNSTLKGKMYSSIPYVGKYIEPLTQNPIVGTLLNMAPEYVGGLVTGQGFLDAGISAVLSEGAQQLGGMGARRVLGQNKWLQGMAGNINAKASDDIRTLGVKPDDQMYAYLKMQENITAGDLAEGVGNAVGGVAGLFALPLAKQIFWNSNDEEEKLRQLNEQQLVQVNNGGMR